MARYCSLGAHARSQGVECVKALSRLLRVKAILLKLPVARPARRFVYVVPRALGWYPGGRNRSAFAQPISMAPSPVAQTKRVIQRCIHELLEFGVKRIGHFSDATLPAAIMREARRMDIRRPLLGGAATCLHDLFRCIFGPFAVHRLAHYPSRSLPRQSSRRGLPCDGFLVHQKITGNAREPDQIQPE